RRLEMVNRTRAELDRQRNRTLLGELVTVQAERETGPGTGGEIAPGLVGVERASLEENVGRLRDLRRGREHVGQCEVEVRVRIVELRRHGVRTEPRRDPTRSFAGT